MNRKWTVPVDGKQYVIEVDYGVCVEDAEEGNKVLFKRDGRLVIDGKDIKTWEAGDLPKEVPFDLAGKPAALKKKGLFNKQLELFFNGQQIKTD